MTLVAYAIVEADAPEIEERGLDGHPLRTVAHDGLAVVVSDHDGPEVTRDAANVWDYERVMERLIVDRTVLPVRFGTVLADEQEARGMLADRAGELKRCLDRVRGMVELGVRAGWSAPAPREQDPGSNGSRGEGAAYMLERLALHRQMSDLVDRLDPLARFAEDVRVRLLGHGELPVLEAYLVDRDQVKEFTERVQEIDERYPEIELVCTGPWPPYSFAAVAGGQKVQDG